MMEKNVHCETDATLPEHADSRLQIVIEDTDESASRHAADYMMAHIRRFPASLLCAATGSTPTRTYELLAEQSQTEPRLFDHLRILKLDEWVGLPASDAGSCESYLRRFLVDPLAIAPDRYFTFDGNAADPAAEATHLAEKVRHLGPIDLCVLGLGLNGHLGFNEPADEIHPGPHLATLADSSRQHPMIRHLAQTDAPLQGLTLGMADILRSRRVLLLVTGPHKRDALRRLRQGRISTQFPASFLHLHPNTLCLCDQAAVAE